MTTEYSVSIDWYDELRNNFENWENLGSYILRDILEDKEHPKFKEVAEELDVLDDKGGLVNYYEEQINSFTEPMMNYGYPLHHEPTDEQTLKIALDTSLTIMYNNVKDEYYLVLCGGGMDLGQSIAHAYMILGYIPDSLAFNVSTQYGLNISGKTYFEVMNFIKNELSNTIESYKRRIKRIDEAIKDAKVKQKH